ncbi:hypothetical protein BCD67_23540 [Oscillatoriales cyanobacterium USR001]|nr:hypothetical protein BCD67_23540 [Oscillatoriales cyanobacterium USR001]
MEVGIGRLRFGKGEVKAKELFSFFPEYWATTQNNLANAYKNKITGNRAENIDRAIACYQLALEVYKREDFPEKWAMTQNNLGSAYRQNHGQSSKEYRYSILQEVISILHPR